MLGELPANADKLQNIILKIAARLHDASGVAKVIDADLTTAYQEVFRLAIYEETPWPVQDINANYNSKDNELRHALQNNVASFSAAKSLEMIQQLQGLLLDEANNLRSFSEYKREVLEVHKLYNVNYLRTEYNDAIANAQMAAQFSRYKSQEKEMPLLICDTAGDGRVRSSHAALDGVCRPIDEWTITPPFDHNCRCDLRQVNDYNLLTDQATRDAALEDLNMKEQFKNNPYLSGKAFSDHPYLVTQDPEGLIRSDYAGLKSVDELYIDTGRMPTAADSVEFEKGWKALKRKRGVQGKDALAIKDVNANIINVDKAAVVGSKSINLLDKTIKTPNEVWQKNGSVSRIKYFKNKAVVHVSTEKGNTSNYHVFEAGDNSVENFREGVLQDRR